MSELTLQQRIDACREPGGWPIMYQSWDRLIFLNWRVSVESLRHLIPAGLEIDTFDGSAWLTVTPLRIYNVRPVLLPPLPVVSEFPELNVRTYVHIDGVPGVWFFSLDADSALAVWGGRTFYKLPYFEARMTAKLADNQVRFHSERKAADGVFSGAWTIGEQKAPSEPGSLEYSLTERYCLYTAAKEKIYRCRIAHRQWPLQEAKNLSYGPLGCISADGIEIPQGEPVAICGGPVTVGV